MLVFSCIVAGSFPLGALAVQYVDAGALIAVRFVMAAICVGIAAQVSGGGLKREHFRAPWRYLLLGGTFALYFVTMFEGLRTAAPVTAASMFTLVPVMAAGFGWLLLRQRTSGRMALALAIGACGAIWVIFDGRLEGLLGFHLGAGEKIYFVGCVAHAIYAPLVPRLNRGEPTVAFTFGTLVAGGILLWIWAWPEIAATDWLRVPPVVWVTLIYTSLGATALTGVLLQFASLGLPAAKVMAYTYLTPSWVILWTVALGGPMPAPMILVGVAMTIVALLLLLKD